MGEGDFSQEQGARRECIEIHYSTRNAALGKKCRAFSSYATTGSLFLKTLKISIRQINVFMARDSGLAIRLIADHFLANDRSGNS
ncbi:MAG: hypothetical protein IZT59_03555 [Verrucomicrobia bacterium]|jgi:hypothetical protein|nr:hypothetical protein [Verrucomicrobiota bacterium]|tara:strand:+ start:5417 stop:5671 length:255 start_codon:yes stop_codon:yes gene_type:complete